MLANGRIFYSFFFLVVVVRLDFCVHFYGAVTRFYLSTGWVPFRVFFLFLFLFGFFFFCAPFFFSFFYTAVQRRRPVGGSAGQWRSKLW